MTRFWLTGLSAAAWAVAAGDNAGLQVLAKRCLSCHGAAKMANLDLRDRAGALRGGARGPAFVPGKPDESVGSSRVDLQACKLEYSIVSPK